MKYCGVPESEIWRMDDIRDCRKIVEENDFLRRNDEQISAILKKAKKSPEINMEDVSDSVDATIRRFMVNAQKVLEEAKNAEQEAKDAEVVAEE